MTLHAHALYGCKPAPLAHYLKALGILRLVGEQKDPLARGLWRDEHFVLLTELSAEQLELFLLHEYAPTPLVSPWNKGAGFFLGRDPALTPLEESQAPRFERFRAGIAAARALLPELADADAKIRDLKAQTKPTKSMTKAEATAARKLKSDPEYKQTLAALEREFKQVKDRLIPLCRKLWRGPELSWLEAALVIGGDGKLAYPALLGTGGNDGRLDFTNNAMQRLASLFDLGSADGKPHSGIGSLLRAALWETPARGLISATIGQFFPGGAGGANSTTGPDGGSSVNSWDFVLMLEGAILFSASATRSLASGGLVQASAPFAMRSEALGYGSTAPGEESARGEQWMPLWSTALSLSELRQLLGEGRAQVHATGAQRPLDMARAVARLGIARGLTGFERYGYLERNGQSNFAVPLGRLEVQEQRHAALVDDLDGWLNRLGRVARAKEAPARLRDAERSLTDAVFAALTHEDEPARWQDVLLAAAAIESLQSVGTGIAAGPIPRLRPEWVAALNDGSPEFRLALALGLAGAHEPNTGAGLDSVRHHFLPVDARGNFVTREPRVVASHRDAAADCLRLVERRLVEARDARRLPIRAARRASARLSDLAALLEGRVDLERCVALGRAFMALDQSAWRRAPVPIAVHKDDAASGHPAQIPAGWAAIRLALLAWPLPLSSAPVGTSSEVQIPAEPSIVRRLSTGDVPGAVEVALRRLNSAGLRPGIRCAATEPAHFQLWAASLAFPITKHSAQQLHYHLLGRDAEKKEVS